jgi:transposase
MFIECVKNNGTKYLRLVDAHTYVITGVRKHQRYVVRNIGPLSRFDDGLPDYMERLRESFRNGTPIIPLLEEYVSGAYPEKKIRFELDVNDDAHCFCQPRNIGYFLLDGLYDALGIYDVLNQCKSNNRVAYDLNGLAKLLVFGRALFPDSKLGTYEQRERYIFDVTSSNNLFEIYQTLDCLNDCADAIQKRMNHKIICGRVGRNTEVCFYDVTNYYFEIGENDSDEVDKDGGVIKKGLRKKGISKEKRGEPIVQMGLFIDDNGIPIAYRLFPGNDTDQTTLRPALKNNIDSLGLGRVIVVADGGLNSGPNIAHILGMGNGYIVSKSTKKSDKNVKAWILDETGYEWNESRTFKVKSTIRKRKIKNEEGKTAEITEKLICYWSKKHYDKECHENEKFIEYLESVIANPDKLKDKPGKIERFLKKHTVDKKTGGIIDADIHLSIDTDKIRDYLNLLGYYTVMTSEIDKPDREIINKYHGLSRIEDSFRITKSDLEGRPVFVFTPEHINAHFLTCFIALTMIRLVQYAILKHQGKDTKNTDGWESGLTAERIQAALGNWQADPLPGGYYRTTKAGEDLNLILDSFGIDGNFRLPTIKALRSLKYSIDKAAFM